MRMKHRYGLSMDDADYDEFCRAFAAGEAQGCRTDDMGNIEGWLRFKDTWVCMSYKPTTRFIGTIMPCPPPLVLKEQAEHAARSAAQPAQPPSWLKNEAEVNRRIADGAKAMAVRLYEQAMNSDKAPKWLQRQLLAGADGTVSKSFQEEANRFAEKMEKTKLAADPAVKRADVSWYKGKLNDARQLLKQGQLFEAACLLDAVASLPASFYPSQDPKKAEAMVKERMERERPFLTKFFEDKGMAQSIAPRLAS